MVRRLPNGFDETVLLNSFRITKLHYHISRMEKNNKNILNDFQETYIANLSEEERLSKDVFRSDMDKLQLFTQMLRKNKLFNKAVIIHK